MQSGKLKTSYFERLLQNILEYTTIIKNIYSIVIVNCQILLFLDNMLLANQNAKLTGPDQGFLVSPSSSHESPGNKVVDSPEGKGNSPLSSTS